MAEQQEHFAPHAGFGLQRLAGDPALWFDCYAADCQRPEIVRVLGGVLVPPFLAMQPAPHAAAVEDIADPFDIRHQRVVDQRRDDSEVLLVLARERDQGHPVAPASTHSSPSAAHSSPVWVPNFHLPKSGCSVSGRT